MNSFPLVVMTYTGGAPDEGEDEEDEEERRWRMPEKFPLWRTRRGQHVNPPEATVLSSPTHAYGRTVQGAGVEVVLPQPARLVARHPGVAHVAEHLKGGGVGGVVTG